MEDVQIQIQIKNTNTNPGNCNSLWRAHTQKVRLKERKEPRGVARTNQTFKIKLFEQKSSILDI